MRMIDADALKKDLTRFYAGEVTARNLVDEQPTIGGWISVKDRLPEEDKIVLVAREFVWPGHKACRYVETAELIGSEWVSQTEEYKIRRRFHKAPYAWMPLPEPPKEETDGRTNP